MRVNRVLKRTLVVLLFLCMILKIHLELRVLREGNNNTGGYSPWWGNETVGHLRAFPKIATKANVTLGALRDVNIADQSSILTKTGVLASEKPPSALKASRGNLVSEPHQQIKNSELNSSYRKILSDGTSRSNTVLSKTSVYKVPRGSGGRELNVMVTKSPSNLKTRAGIDKTRTGIFAKLTIYDGENTIDTDTIYYEQKRENPSGNSKNKSKTFNQNSKKTKISTSASIKKPSITQTMKTPNTTKILRRVLPSSKFRTASKPLSKKVKASVSKAVSHDIDMNEMSLTKEAIAKFKKELRVENERQTIYNQERFGPIHRNTTIFLVQVHKRLQNLRYLVSSLKAVKGIQDEAMVVFSHDLWDPAINAFVRNITDFRVMQMFFPFSIQLYPHVFPGRDPADCSWNTTTTGKNISCRNVNWPDSYGHFREASFTQIKHHWWWKIHRVFEGLKVTQNNYTGHVVFLEEDHYVSPDLLHVLGLMQRLRPSLCPSCQVFALGNYNKLSSHIYKNFVERGDWWVTKYNLGFAMDAAIWRSISKCKDHFCNFDDYNWDWTMTNVGQTCVPKRLSMLSIRLTRVLHVGSCGTHVRKKVCDVEGEVRNAISRISSGKLWLYPETLKMQGSWKNSGKPKKGNGGWGDKRDRELCRAIGNSTIDTNEGTLRRLQAMRS